ncbi:hypothetical protein [Stenotrophobium rhamnosiphilum]|uniref:Uncharacterized protein n=1 Tax=Stenotrophobium rhamnosiphilum TaxID=2029166 RepID=A0A2T5MKL0_9GAMM|nr:hypothetical protein [Stenotrophobium rhamnosiphilum]PTU33123.1 hypothetical protein CJD38_03185 [Stenotrophobium rhamnosiphilum]
MTPEMTDLLLNCQIAALPFAWTAMLIAGLRFYKDTAYKSAAVFSLGMGVLVLSELLSFAAYKIWPVVYERDIGIVQVPFRDSMVWFTMGLNVLGLLISSIGLLTFSWARGLNRKKH